MVWSLFWVIFFDNFESNWSKPTSSVNKLNLLRVSIALSSQPVLTACGSLFKSLTISSTVHGCELLVAMTASISTSSFAFRFTNANFELTLQSWLKSNSSSSIGSSSLQKTSLKWSVIFIHKISWDCVKVPVLRKHLCSCLQHVWFYELPLISTLASVT